MTPKEAAYQKISELVQRFSEQFASYKNVEYNETLTRRDFIDPFFKALGWDIDNQQGYAEAYREVIHEDKIKIGSATKAPDYSFKIGGGKRLFFVEAKKPSVDIKEGVKAAFQVRHYGWNAGLGISVITDFEEFSIYDCTKKPKQGDKAAVARIRYLTFKDYLKEFDFIWETFSKEQVLKGSFDKFVAGAANKKGTTTVDKDFLESLDKWRTQLASNISRNNQQLDEDELNFAVQQTINRIIFLRIAEDRSIEPYGNLRNALHDTNYYKNLFDSFKTADDKYNSGLFDFKKDRICESLIIDNKVLKTIVNELYQPISPYNFAFMSVEILGSAYEQFLGKVIRVTPAHFVKVEEKPEVRKAGGVYYTPQYIVDYIVQNTVGKLTEGKTPAQVSDLKICDPACGSGSFLIGAYQYLLDWHKNYYTDNGKSTKTNKDNTLTPDGNLTATEKKRILLNNIYGVDIDANAVEVTKLSLLLKCLEGETEASIKNQLSMFHERVLPTLDNNIKDGNSLIDIDIYEGELDLGFEKKIKPFSWQKAFPDIFKIRKAEIDQELKWHNTQILNQAKAAEEKAKELIKKLLGNVEEPNEEYSISGGFDVVLGNPPYGATFTKPETEYFLKIFRLQDYQFDSYYLFIEKSLDLLCSQGLLGFIIPNTWLVNLKSTKIRRHLFSKIEIENIIHFQNPVFDQAVVDTEILIFKNSAPISAHEIQIDIFNKKNEKAQRYIKQQIWIDGGGSPVNIFDCEENISIKSKLNALPILDYLCKITQGTKPFQVGKGKPPQTRKTVDDKTFVSKINIDNSYRPLLRGSLMNRYEIIWNNDYFILFGDWLAEPRYSAEFDAKEKIIIRQTGDHLNATLDSRQFIVRDNLYTIVSKKTEINLKYILGLINSKFLNWYYQNIINPEKGEALAQVKRGHIALLPIKEINLRDDSEIVLQNKIISLVDQLLQLNQQKRQIKLESALNQIKSKIDYCEGRINEIVYELYGLTEEEIKIVEGKNV